MTTPAMKALAQLGMGSADPVDQAMEFISETLKQTETQFHSPGIRGERSRRKERVRTVRKAVSGAIVQHPTPTELDFLLPYILGGTTAGGVTDIADALTEVYIQIDRVSKVHLYNKCICSRATLRAASGQPLELTTEWEGETETESASGSFPALTLPTDNIFVFSDLTLTLEGVTCTPNELTVVLDNYLEGELYRNAVSRVEIPPGDREVTLNVVVPYDADHTALYNAAIAGAAGTIVYSDGSTTYTIDIANVKIPADSPNVPAQGEIPHSFTANCYADASNSEFKVTKT